MSISTQYLYLYTKSGLFIYGNPDGSKQKKKAQLSKIPGTGMENFQKYKRIQTNSV